MGRPRLAPLRPPGRGGDRNLAGGSHPRASEPGSTAGVLIFENLWAAPFASAARRSGGQLIANGRIPIQAIIASIEAEPVGATEGD